MGERHEADGGRSYLVAGSRPWNRQTYDQHLQGLPGRWRFVANPDELAAAFAEEPPRYAFFLHWSWIVPASIHEASECVVFHAADVPYGRGGSPIQNLLLRGHDDTVLSALRMTEELDAGPVYAKVPVSLEGTVEDILRRIDAEAVAVIRDVIVNEPDPVRQEGEPVVFRRRTPDQSEVPADLAGLDAWHRYIRMLDGEGYPPAFIDHGPFRISFRRAVQHADRVDAEVSIALREEQL